MEAPGQLPSLPSPKSGAVRGCDMTYNERCRLPIFITNNIVIDQSDARIKGHWVRIPFI